MKKFFIYFFLYVVFVVILVTKDRYFGEGWAGINGTLSWEQILNTNLKEYLLFPAIIVLICYFLDIKNTKKSDDSDKSDDMPS